MQKPQYVEGWFVPSESGDGPVDPDFGIPGGGKPNRPGHPLPLPPLPGVWPKPGEPSLPIVLPPGIWPPSGGGQVTPPIYIPEEPGHPLPLPPGSIWPPLPPDLGLSGKVAILIWVVGTGFRWFIYDSAQVAPPIELPGTPSPKR